MLRLLGGALGLGRLIGSRLAGGLSQLTRGFTDRLLGCLRQRALIVGGDLHHILADLRQILRKLAGKGLSLRLLGREGFGLALELRLSLSQRLQLLRRRHGGSAALLLLRLGFTASLLLLLLAGLFASLLLLLTGLIARLLLRLFA